MPSISLPAVSLAVGAVGTGISALGAIQQGEAAQQSANYQAQVAQNNATIAGQNKMVAAQEASATAQQQGIAVSDQIGRTRAAYGADNVDPNTGSAAQVQQGARQVGDLSQSNIINQGDVAQYGYASQIAGFQGQAALDTFQGNQAASAGLIGAGGSLLQGLGTFGARYSFMNQSGANALSI